MTRVSQVSMDGLALGACSSRAMEVRDHPFVASAMAAQEPKAVSSLPTLLVLIEQDAQESEAL